MILALLATLAEPEAARAPARVVPDEATRAALVAAMFDAHYDAVWRTLRRLGVPDAEVDDAAQRVFLVGARRLEDIRPGEEGKYLVGVATRVASEVRRRHPARREVPDDALAEVPDDAPGPEAALSQAEARAVLDEVLGGMPEDLREVLVLVEIEGMSGGEVAELLALPSGTVASRLRRAREAFSEGAQRWRARHAHGGGR